MLLAKAEWGTVPDWVTAFGTLAAFAVALRLLAKELTARHEQQQDQRRDQARRITAWANPWPDPRHHVVVMRNNSEEPVSALTLVMEHPDMPGTVTREESWDLLPPGTRRAEDEVFPAPGGPITLSFTDAAGRRWTRYPDGRLVEVGRSSRSRKDYMNAWIAGELQDLDY
jgi:hypothetical protein